MVKEYLRGLGLGGGIRGIIYQRKGSDYYYYHYNHKGDVVALTDGNGELAAYYEYDAWGNTMTEAETSGVDNPYRYSTKEWDEKSGLYYFGARYYYPEIGRWTQRDPAGIVDGLNLYSYVRNDPLGQIDPEGKFMWPFRKKKPKKPKLTPAQKKMLAGVRQKCHLHDPTYVIREEGEVMECCYALWEFFKPIMAVGTGAMKLQAAYTNCLKRSIMGKCFTGKKMVNNFVSDIKQGIFIDIITPRSPPMPPT